MFPLVNNMVESICPPHCPTRPSLAVYRLYVETYKQYLAFVKEKRTIKPVSGKSKKLESSQLDTPGLKEKVGGSPQKASSKTTMPNIACSGAVPEAPSVMTKSAKRRLRRARLEADIKAGKKAPPKRKEKSQPSRPKGVEEWIDVERRKNQVRLEFEREKLNLRRNLSTLGTAVAEESRFTTDSRGFTVKTTSLRRSGAVRENVTRSEARSGIDMAAKYHDEKLRKAQLENIEASTEAIRRGRQAIGDVKFFSSRNNSPLSE